MSYRGRRRLACLTLLGLIAVLACGGTFAAGKGRPALEQRRAAKGPPACTAGAHHFRCHGISTRALKGHAGSIRRALEPPGTPGIAVAPGVQVPTPPGSELTTEGPGIEPPSESPVAPPVVFDGAFEPGFPGWYMQALPGRVTLREAPPVAEGLSARFEVKPGDVEPDTGSQRAEVTGPTFEAGEEIYVRDDIRIPAGWTFEGPWQLIDQLHEKPWSGSPGIATFLDPERRISFGAGDGSPFYWRGPQLETERWYEFVYHVDLSRNAAEGFVELWLDGVQQVLADGTTRMYGETIQTEQTYLKAGIYRSASSSGVSVVEHAGLAVGSSLESVLLGG